MAGRSEGCAGRRRRAHEAIVMAPPRSAFGAPPQGGAASGPAEPVPRLLLGRPVAAMGHHRLAGWRCCGWCSACGPPARRCGPWARWPGRQCLVRLWHGAERWPGSTCSRAWPACCCSWPFRCCTRCRSASPTTRPATCWTEARARAYLLDQTVADEAGARPFTLHAEGSAHRCAGCWRRKKAAVRPALVSPAGPGRRTHRRRW
jgi:hypothetical protein